MSLGGVSGPSSYVDILLLELLLFDAEGLTSPNKIAINKGKNMIKNLEMIDAIGPREPFAGVATIVYQKAF